MHKAIVTSLVAGEDFEMLWGMGYRYTVLVVAADDPTDVLDMVDFKTIEKAETYAEWVSNEQSNG